MMFPSIDQRYFTENDVFWNMCRQSFEYHSEPAAMVTSIDEIYAATPIVPPPPTRQGESKSVIL
jgi:hypothetical protein